MADFLDFLAANWYLSVPLVIVVLAFFKVERVMDNAIAKPLSEQALVQMMNREAITIVDLRPAERFKKGHIPQAFSFPSAQPTDTLIPLPSAEVTGMVWYCENGADALRQIKQRSPTLPKIAQYYLSGGYSAWQQAGLPVESQK